MIGLSFVGASPGITFRGDTLGRGGELHTGMGLISRNGRARVVLQPDGNFVLYGDGRPLWWTGVHPGTNVVVMQDDGNLVLYVRTHDGQTPVWASDTSGGGAKLVIQNDGNLVVYSGGRALWSSQTNGFRYYGGPSGPNLFQKIAHLASAPARTAAELGLKAATGKDFHVTSVSATPADILRAARQIVSFVPGIGQGINAAISAGEALASGENITDAIAAAAKNALPGGPLVAQGFDTAYHFVRGIAKGENVGDAALHAARENLPSDELKRAFDVGLAVAHGQNLQDAVKSGAVDYLKSRAGSVATGLLPKVPNMNIQLPAIHASASASTALAAAHSALGALEAGSAVKKLQANVADGAKLIADMRTAVQSVGPAAAKATLAAHPAIAQKARRALVVIHETKRVSPAAVNAVEAKSKAAWEQIAKIAWDAEHSPDPARRAAAQKAVQVLKIAANARKNIRGHVVNQKGGILGVTIDGRGRLTKGRFVVDPKVPETILYASGALHRGRYRKV